MIAAVVSGNCDREAITKQEVRYAGIDGRPPDLDSDAPAESTAIPAANAPPEPPRKVE